MTNPPLELGAVYQAAWAQEPVRIVAYDGDAVMYDTWWPHKQAWAMSKLTGTFTYYRVHRPFFESHASFIRVDAYTPQEAEVHRPDLPFAVAQNEQLSWYQQQDNIHVQAQSAEATLDAPAIYLAPFGPKDSAKPPVRLEAKNGRAFSATELLRLAYAVQTPFLGHTHLTEGVGIYRSGIKKRIPSYYIWGAKSRLDSQR